MVNPPAHFVVIYGSIPWKFSIPFVVLFANTYIWHPPARKCKVRLIQWTNVYSAMWHPVLWINSLHWQSASPEGDARAAGEWPRADGSQWETVPLCAAQHTGRRLGPPRQARSWNTVPGQLLRRIIRYINNLVTLISTHTQSFQVSVHLVK